MGNGIVKEKNRKIIFDKGCSRIRKICFMPQDSPEKKTQQILKIMKNPPEYAENPEKNYGINQLL